MLSDIRSVAFVVLILSAVWIGTKLRKRSRNAALAKWLDCQPTVENRVPFWDPLALKETLHILKLKSQGRLMLWWKEQQGKASNKAGRDVTTLMTTVAGQREIYTTDPRNIQAILATQFEDFLIELTRRPMLPLSGKGIFTVDGSHWQHSRAMLKPSFTRQQVSDLDIEEKHCKNLMRALPVEDDGWTRKVDMMSIFSRHTLDRATDFLLGESVESQLNEISGEAPSGPASQLIDQFAGALDKSMDYCGHRFLLGPNYWLLNSKAFQGWNKQVHGLVDYYVQLALSIEPQADIQEKQTAGEKHLFLRELVQHTRDPVQLRAEILNILLAGRDTTANTLSFMFLLLATHPKVYTKLRSTVLESFGPLPDENPPTFESLKACQYLQQCTNEVLRLYPTLPLNQKSARRDTSLPMGGGVDGKSPIFIPAGDVVWYSVYVMHHDKALWGEDADDFKPERWNGLKHGWEYLPFNGGPRVCIGQQFALTSMAFTVVRLLQRFDQLEYVGLALETPMKMVNSLTCRPFEGAPLRLHEAAKEKRA